MQRLVTPVLSFFVVCAIGCGIGPHVDDFNEAIVAKESAVCACPLGYESEADCRADRIPTAAEQACVEALFKNIDGDYEAHLDCRTGVNNRYAGCLNSRTCTDLARGGCVADYLDEIEDCPAFPGDIEQELVECLN